VSSSWLGRLASVAQPQWSVLGPRNAGKAQTWADAGTAAATWLKVAKLQGHVRAMPKAPRGWSPGRGFAPSLPGKYFDDLILKWHILMHISGILTYLFSVLLSPPGEGSARGAVPPTRKFLIITNKLIKLSSLWRRERTAALHRSPQNNVFGATVVQFRCILSYVRLPVLKHSKNFLGDWGATPGVE